jgi:hypothetical protein
MTARPEHRPGLTYAITNRQALTLLACVHPYLRSYKRHRSALVLAHYVALTPRNGKYTRELAAAREVLEDTFLALTPRIRERAGQYSAQTGS